MQRLQTILERIDGRGYKAYKELEGEYAFPGFTLIIDHVQGDPFAAPSRISVFLPATGAGFPFSLRESGVRRRALEDYLGRAVAAAIDRHVKGLRGSGKSGRFAVATSGQQVLTRNAVLVSEGGVEARLTVGLPAAGRTIRGREARAMLCHELPEVVRNGLLYARLPADRVRAHVDSVEDQDHLRRRLEELGLVAFVADGACLPRRSGVDDRPLDPAATVPFAAPPGLAVEIDLPHAGTVRGMGIPTGVTLIVGGGFHGKSTLLHALERGVYDHLPGDGRERVATRADAVKIRAEDGRAITGTNISPFITNLPLGRDTRRFHTENASGSTSQAANIMEALETGSRLLLVDEDTSATNFMIRDTRMQALVTREREPITPLLHRIRELHIRHGVSTVLVMGGTGDYFAVADTVIMLDNYRVHDVTAEARRLAGKPPAASGVPLPDFDTFPERRPEAHLLDPGRGNKLKITAPDRGTLRYGCRAIDLGQVEQLVDRGQTEAVGWLIRHYAHHYYARHTSLVPGLKACLEEVGAAGLDRVTPWKSGELALPRLQELAAAVNRLRPAPDSPAPGRKERNSAFPDSGL